MSGHGAVRACIAGRFCDLTARAHARGIGAYGVAKFVPLLYWMRQTGKKPQAPRASTGGITAT